MQLHLADLFGILPHQSLVILFRRDQQIDRLFVASHFVMILNVGGRFQKPPRNLLLFTLVARFFVVYFVSCNDCIQRTVEVCRLLIFCKTRE